MTDVRRIITVYRTDKPNERYHDDRIFSIAESKEDGKTIEISSSAEVTISLNPNITVKGMMYLKNWDSVNFINFGFATGVYPVVLRPLDVNIISLVNTTSTLYARANNSPCELQYWVVSQPL